MTASLKTISWKLRAMIAPGFAVIAMLMANSPLFGGTWASVPTTNLPASAGLCNPLLLTDGTVIVLNCVTPDWYKLTPDKTGSYVKGTWSKIGSLPNPPGSGGYGPEWFASAVLPDGRVIIEGGEYNKSCTLSQIWTSLGAIYDPVTNVWTYVPPPFAPFGAGWNNSEPCGTVLYNGGIGDAPSIVLPNGQFMLGACCADPALNALFNASTMTWSSTGAPKNQCQTYAATHPAPPNNWCTAGLPYQGEQGYTLLPNGKVLTISVWNPPNAEVYDPATGTWSPIAPTLVQLPDPSGPAGCNNYEIGPALTRPDGTVVAFSGHTGCTPTPNSPTQIYTVSTDTWVTGPDVPQICGPTTAPVLCTLADAPAAMLPNGNILFAASPYNNPPTHFFEFTSATSRKPNMIEKVDDAKSAPSTPSFKYNFLVLPNGHILATNLSNNIAEIYTPTGHAASDWEPKITSVPECVTPGRTYSLSGVQLNGLSQGAAYGDDVQGATNYPLVRIVNNRSGHVFYARTFDFSTMSIAPGQAGSTKFFVTLDTEAGPSELYVVANGIHSARKDIKVGGLCTVIPRPPPGCGSRSQPNGSN